MLLITDLDGTLLNDDSKVSQHSIDTLRKLKKQGTHIAIATGRGYNSAHKIKEQIGIEMFMICNNGANIFDPNDKVIQKNFIPKEIARQVIKILTEQKIDYKGFDNLDFYMPTYGEVISELKSEYKMKKVENYQDIPELEKILVINDNPDILNTARRLLEKDFSEQLEIVISSPTCLDINIKGCSKRTGVEIIAKELGVSVENIVAFGDSENDYRMLNYVGRPISMKGSFISTKISKEITDYTNDEDGVARYIEKEFLK